MARREDDKKTSQPKAAEGKRHARREERNVRRQHGKRHGKTADNPLNLDIVGRRVEYRTPTGYGEGKVLEVMDRESAQAHAGRALSRPGAWLFVTGQDYPIHRRRVRLLPEKGHRR